jgi:hypothetical protein
MNKRTLISEIESYLKDELSAIVPGSPEALTKGDELNRTLTMLRFLPVRDYTSDDPVVPSALVELRLESQTAFYFLVPSGGGLITRVDGKPVQVITPQSPLGHAMLGKKVGDLLSVQVRDSVREYKIISVR